MSARPETCRAVQCVICHDFAHRLGELCETEDRCPVHAINLGMACRRCYDRMAAQLREIPELYALAGGEMGMSSGSSGGRSTEPSLGLRVAALDLRSGADVFATLGTWEVEWAETYGETTAPLTSRSRHPKDPIGQTLVDLVARIRAGLHRACMSHPGVDVFARDLNTLHAAAKVAARTTGRRNTEVDCPADQPDTGTCGARIRINGLELDDVVYCPRCRSRWVLKRLLRVAAADSEAGVWVAAEDASLLVGLSRATLDRWAKAGRVQRRNGLLELQSIHDAIRTGGSTAGASA